MSRKETQKALDSFAVAAENDRMSKKFAEILEDEPFCRFEEWAESITEVAEIIGRAKDACQEWNESEDREEKAISKERALECLDELVQSWNASTLDLRDMRDWDPEIDVSDDFDPNFNASEGE